WLDRPDLKLEGFVGPGHVSAVIGARVYEFVPLEYGKPLVVSGFEPLDVLQSVSMIVKQIAEGRAEVENQYSRFVSRDGNANAMAAICEVFESRDFFEWRGPRSDRPPGPKLRQRGRPLPPQTRSRRPPLGIP